MLSSVSVFEVPSLRTRQSNKDRMMPSGKNRTFKRRTYLTINHSVRGSDSGLTETIMFYFDKKLQYPVKVETPNPIFARMLQQAIGGIEGEIRVCMQYFFQAWGSRGPDTKFRDMLLNTATEEMGHIEMLATAVAMNLDGAPTSLQEEGAKDKVVGAIMGGSNGKHAIEGMLQRHILSTGMAAYPANSDGVPFDMSHIYASGNIAADMYCNVAAEATGRVLACRLYGATSDAGHEGHAELHDRARHDAPAAMACGAGRTGRPRRHVADPQQLPAGAGER